MMFITHMSVALFAGLLKVRLIPIPINKYAFLLIVVFASLLPDIDTDSFISRKLKLKTLSHFFKHRGFFHSIIPMVFLIILAFLITQNIYYSLAVFIGFASHLFFDSFTTKGTTLFWPHKLRIRGPLKTGGVFDWVFLVCFLVVDVIMVLNIF